MKEFNLSEMIIGRRKLRLGFLEILDVTDVKEFIRLLKEEFNSAKYKDYEYPAYQTFFRIDKEIEKIIDKLAGDKLI